MLYGKLSIIKKAKDCFIKTIQYKPDYDDAYANLGRCLFIEKKYKESIKNCQISLELKDSLINSWIILIQCYIALKNNMEIINTVIMMITIAAPLAA